MTGPMLEESGGMIESSSKTSFDENLLVVIGTTLKRTFWSGSMRRIILGLSPCKKEEI